MSFLNCSRVLKVFFSNSSNRIIESDEDFLLCADIDEKNTEIALAIRQALALTANIPRNQVVSSMRPNEYARKMRTWIDDWDPISFIYNLEKTLKIKISYIDMSEFPILFSSIFFRRKGAESIGQWTHSMVYNWFPSVLNKGDC